MSMTSELVNKIRTVANNLSIGHNMAISEAVKLFRESADAIETLSTKLSKANMEWPAQFYKESGLIQEVWSIFNQKYNDATKFDEEETELAKNVLIDFQKVLERSESYYSGGWIPCDELLPEEKENPVTKDWYEYQVTFRTDDITDIRYYKFGKGHWWHGFEIMDEYVTAWKPRPVPYKNNKNNS